MFQNRSVDVHQFAMIPRADIPRSRFRIETAHKTTFDANYLVPFFRMEALPGDSLRVDTTAFARMATPLYPLMDNLYLDTFFFFVPYRLVWTNFVKMMGQQANPADSISFTTPQQVCPASGYAINSLQDYFGLPTVGQVGGGNTVSHSALPLRAYNLIWNEWFRDENLQNSVTVDTGDGPDTVGNYVILKRGKRKDYFTSALPWPQKGSSAVSLPLGTTAPVYGTGKALGLYDGTTTVGLASTASGSLTSRTGDYNVNVGTANSGAALGTDKAMGVVTSGTSGLYADLSAATAATINQLRQAFQIQKLLERDARGGTRYTEVLRAHFNVVSPDARLQRPEYLGGGSSRVVVNPIAQTGPTGTSGSSTPLGQLGAMATTLAKGHGFSHSFVEHGIIIGLMSVRADLTYQQGLERFWSRSTRYDHYWPAFAMLGEQAVLNKEIYCDGSANDALTFGYQSRWDEYRYYPAQISGLFRSTAAGTLDGWHAAQKFTALPTLNSTFIQESVPMDRILAVASQTGKHFYFDSLTQINAVRPLPMYSVPGLIDHF